jgi:hypothetical protein
LLRSTKYLKTPDINVGSINIKLINIQSIFAIIND